MQLILQNPLDALIVFAYASFSLFTVYHALVSGEVKEWENMFLAKF
jgi:hypothetical protein